MSEDEGHEDKLIHRIIDEAVKNIFTLTLTPANFAPSSIISRRARASNRRRPSRPVVLERIGKVPGLREAGGRARGLVDSQPDRA